METMIAYLILVLLVFWMVRAVVRGLRWAFWMGIHWVCGFVCLWLVNLETALLPVNSVTVLTAGMLGLPGIAVLAILAKL